jgi:tripartite-type tricarboxylate transporter receptor subunit TctC
MKALSGVLVALFVVLLGSQPLRSQEAAASFAGKRINLYIGFSPTGFGYDTYGRLLAKYLGKHIPGNPAVIPQNRPGAGSLSLVTYLYNAGAKDGTDIGLVGRGAAMEPMLSGGSAGAKFDATKLNWIGSMNNEVAGFFISDKSPAKDLKAILAGTSIQVGSTGSGGDPQTFANAINAVFKTNLRIVAGYPGMNEILLGISRNELDGVLGYSWGVARMGSRDQLAEGKLKLVMQLALKKHQELPDVPLVTDFATGDDKRVLEVIFARQSMGRPLVAPPGLDPAVVAALRRGFAETMRDPGFIADCEKINLEINFVSGEDVQALMQQISALPESVIAEARKIVAAK